MYNTKIIFDSDALIKLVKAGIPKKVFKEFKWIITNEVYEETVIDGKKALYEDAYWIDMGVKENLIKKIKAGHNKKAQEILNHQNLGKGEKSAVHLYFNAKADAICSDDEKFLNVLLKNNIRFLTPLDLILRLIETKIISNNEANNLVDNLKEHITEENYKRFRRLN